MLWGECGGRKAREGRYSSEIRPSILVQADFLNKRVHLLVGIAEYSTEIDVVERFKAGSLIWGCHVVILFENVFC